MSYGGGGASSGAGRDQGGDQSWRKNVATHMMSNEEIKKAGVEESKRPPGHNPGGVLHQRKGLPFKVPTMALAGFAVVGLLGYTVLYSKKKAEADAIDVARVASNSSSTDNVVRFDPKK